MGHINRLLFVYFAAMIILVACVVTNFVVTFQIGERLEKDAARINVSGRQRMLSQRIIYLAQDLTQEPSPDGQAALTQTIAQFEAGIDLFARSHDALSGHPSLEPVLTSLYFEAENGPSLDARVREYIRLARQVAQTPSDIGSLAALKQIERGGLLRDLDAVVGELEAISVARARQLRNIGYLSLLVAFLIVLLEVALVFLPGHRIIRQALHDLRRRNTDLETTQQQVDDQNAELQRRATELAYEKDRLQASLEESEALRREQVEFTYAVSHDLKSPTNTIRMVLDEITEDDASHLSQEMQDMITHAQSTIVRMGTQIEDILAYARSAQNTESARLVDLGATMKDVLSDLAGEIASSGARVEVGPLPSVWGYSKQLHALLLNLVSNGMKYQPKGTAPVVEIRCQPIPDESGVCLEVSDNGIGIAPEHHSRIFGMFQRLHRREDYPGSGLGLTTCLRIAQNHEGRIDVTSAPGEGATFAITLRLQDDSQSKTEDLAA